MTEIDITKANREFDAELWRLMGYKVVGLVHATADGNDGDWFVRDASPAGLEWDDVYENGPVQPAYPGRRCYCDYRNHSAWPSSEVYGHLSQCLEVVPSLSLDIAAAWKVVEKLQERKWYVALTNENGPGKTWWVTIYDSTRGGWNDVAGNWDDQLADLQAETLPLAICQAAYIALTSQA
jgi:hypothetical protein